jgi:hypothetical protein
MNIIDARRHTANFLIFFGMIVTFVGCMVCAIGSGIAGAGRQTIGV